MDFSVNPTLFFFALNFFALLEVFMLAAIIISIQSWAIFATFLEIGVLVPIIAINIPIFLEIVLRIHVIISQFTANVLVFPNILLFIQFIPRAHRVWEISHIVSNIEFVDMWSTHRCVQSSSHHDYEWAHEKQASDEASDGASDEPGAFVVILG